ERARKPRIASLGELHSCLVAPLDLEIAEALAHEELLELRLLLQVVLLISQAGEIERRHRDVHVPALEELRHVAIEKRQHKGAYVRAVDVGGGNDEDSG